ncbi:MerR family transcriptional regulator [Paenibacillus agricola]|uniref:MerR family transcriptional regulator n=1 Tax=Paenibacillus agricola TaxID=2716264 RepID=A0ABX0JD00_9BACL|nr:MerR family transcriptional regulator [Paenibacillus agricola]NHN33438.1 MerR family transcriptional regulator [Paenibacillus agricola]
MDEKIGLLPPVKRKENGQKEYDKLDLDRFIFITHLKRTNMPLKEIERYMTLASILRLKA